MASPSENHKNLETLSRSRPPGAVMDAVWGQASVRTSVKALQPLLAYVPRRRYDATSGFRCTLTDSDVASSPRISFSRPDRACLIEMHEVESIDIVATLLVMVEKNY